jgi:hypothetical protein
LIFRDSSASAVRQHIVADSSSLLFGSGDASFTERMRIDASGNVLAGTATTAIPNQSVNTGVFIFPGGSINVARNADECAIFNRLSTDGEVVRIQKDGTTVGSIGTFGGVSYYGGTASGLMFNGPNINPTNGTSVRTDGTNDIGATTYRFKDLHLAGGVFLGGTGAANKLDDYEEGTWTPTFTGLTVGNGSVFGTYRKVGKLVYVQFGFRFGSTTSMTTLSDITGLPFISKSEGGATYTHVAGVAFDVGARWYAAEAVQASGSASCLIPSLPNYNTAISSTAPFTWVTNDTLTFNATFAVS